MRKTKTFWKLLNRKNEDKTRGGGEYKIQERGRERTQRSKSAGSGKKPAMDKQPGN